LFLNKTKFSQGAKKPQTLLAVLVFLVDLALLVVNDLLTDG
jgi:hypothetical protein